MRGQGGIAALAVAVVLGVIGWSQSRLGGGEPSVSPEQRSAHEGRATGADVDRSSAAEDELFAAMNRARRAKRLPALRASAPLARAARTHSEDLSSSSRCSHDGRDGTTLEDRLATAKANVRRYGEVVACGSANAEAAVEQWLGSDAHRAILLGRTFEVAGVGVALGTTAADARWTVVLGTP